jgi:Na+/proline symporter
MNWFEKLDENDLNDSIKRILRAKAKEKNTKRNVLIIFFVVILLATLLFFYLRILDKQTFQLIWTAVIGGFVGASLNLLLSE